jgi:hypothetical protein
MPLPKQGQRLCPAAQLLTHRSLAGVLLCTILALEGCEIDRPTEPASIGKSHPNFAYASGSILDDFSDADGTLLENHTPDGGAVSFTWTKAFGTSSAGIQANALATYDWGYLTSLSDADSAEIEVQLTGDISNIPRQYDVGIVLRTTSSVFSGYTIYWSMYGSDDVGSPNAFITVDRPDRNMVYQDNLPVPTAGTHTFSAAVQSNGVINVYIDDVLMATGSDPSPLPSGKPGLLLDL